MARRRKTSSGALIVLALIGFIASRIGGVGCVLLAVGGAIALWWLISGNEEPSKEPKLDRERGRRKLGSSLAGITISMNSSSDDELVTVRVPERQGSGFKLPTPPTGYGKARWFGPGESTEIAGLRLIGGLFYVGTDLRAPNGQVDPCLIDPTKRVASSGDFKALRTQYWPGYATISPEARRAYLEWMADGRRDPHADIGFVFLFFYGLERRVLVDGVSDPEVQRDLSDIGRETRRLLQIYGGASNSFRMYGGGFLNWLELTNPPPKLYLRPVPELPGGIGVPFYIRVALGQAALDRSPLSTALALAWIKAEPSTRWRTAAKRCPAEFEKLFEQKYRAAFGAGFVIPLNRTKLKFVYSPASSGLMRGDSASTFGDLPDVTAVAGPIKRLQDLADETTAALEPYSRLVGRQPEAASLLDGLSLLPTAIWPAAALGSVRSARAQMNDGRVLMECSALIGHFGAKSVPPRGRFAAFAQALEGHGLGLEPDVLARARIPKLEEAVVLFELAPSEGPRAQNGAYLVAELTLQLASAVAASDGSFGALEVSHLRAQIDRWQHLTPNERRRLHAQLSLLEREPESTTGMKKKFEPLDVPARETIAAIVVSLAQSDGQVSPEEVRALEKAYKVLGVEVKRLFSDLHGASTRATDPQSSPSSSARGFQLDQGRIAQLQQDTERVSAMLSEIFSEPDVSEVPADPIAAEEAEEPAADSILSLDGTSSAFARLVITRPRWARSDLQDVASDMELMLDGALERLNEASFEKFDLPLVEGDDPVEVNAEVVERLSA